MDATHHVRPHKHRRRGRLGCVVTCRQMAIVQYNDPIKLSGDFSPKGDQGSAIARLRHAATHALLERRDVIVVASVSCIYGLGSPSEYAEAVVTFKSGEVFDMEEVLEKLVQMQFTRNEMVLQRGTFRVRGDTLE